MNWTVGLLLLIAAGAIYKIAHERGKRKVSQQVQAREEALDREEAQNELEEHHNSNAWDNLNDTISSHSRGKK